MYTLQTEGLPFTIKLFAKFAQHLTPNRPPGHEMTNRVACARCWLCDPWFHTKFVFVISCSIACYITKVVKQLQSACLTTTKERLTGVTSQMSGWIKTRALFRLDFVLCELDRWDLCFSTSGSQRSIRVGPELGEIYFRMQLSRHLITTAWEHANIWSLHRNSVRHWIRSDFS